MAKYLSTKTYGNDRGFSCCFRQWPSTHSHCSLLHGYSIGIRLTFESETLDDRNWVMDFGGLSAFKAWAEHMFDHTMLVAQDDPFLYEFQRLSHLGHSVASGTGSITDVAPNERGAVCDLRIVEAVGCEKFAELAYRKMQEMLDAWQSGTAWCFTDTRGGRHSFDARYPVGQGVRLQSVEVFEHLGNSAIYQGI